jgi:hypothetical protein
MSLRGHLRMPEGGSIMGKFCVLLYCHTIRMQLIQEGM